MIFIELLVQVACVELKPATPWCQSVFT